MAPTSFRGEERRRRAWVRRARARRRRWQAFWRAKARAPGWLWNVEAPPFVPTLLHPYRAQEGSFCWNVSAPVFIPGGAVPGALQRSPSSAGAFLGNPIVDFTEEGRFVCEPRVREARKTLQPFWCQRDAVLSLHHFRDPRACAGSEAAGGAGIEEPGRIDGRILLHRRRTGLDSAPLLCDNEARSFHLRQRSTPAALWARISSPSGRDGTSRRSRTLRPRGSR